MIGELLGVLAIMVGGLVILALVIPPLISYAEVLGRNATFGIYGKYMDYWVEKSLEWERK